MANKTLVFVFLVLLLSGCVTAPINSNGGSLAQSVIVLHIELTYQPDQVGIYIQDGKVTSSRAIDVYRPHCSFDLHKKARQVIRIMPDQFRVYQVTYNNASVKTNTRPRLFNYASFVSLDPSWQTYTTTLYLSSASQPQVYQLTCEHVDDPQDPRYLSVPDIRQALGAVASLELRLPEYPDRRGPPID